MELKITIDGLEKERDFYFGKLRDIEVLCQEADKNPIIQKILEILYATEVRSHLVRKAKVRLSVSFVLANIMCYRIVSRKVSNLIRRL